MSHQNIIRAYTQLAQGQWWMREYWGRRPRLACVLGFTKTALIPGISAAGATPEDRLTTAIADAEFLYRGVTAAPNHPLPPLSAGVSPALITRAIIAAQRIPLQLFNAGLPIAPTVPCIDLKGSPANCLSAGQAMAPEQVNRLLREGLGWGHRLGQEAGSGYVVLGECVVGGTTTALAVLLGLGYDAAGKVGSSHTICNHDQKQKIVAQGLNSWRQRRPNDGVSANPLELVAAVGDPMQITAAALMLSASCHGGVLLAGGTQMLAVYALGRALARRYRISWQPEQVVVGTTRWVAEDPGCQTVELADLIGEVPLLATQLSFKSSSLAALQKYEAGYVKEGIAAGGCAIAASLYQDWHQPQLLSVIEALVCQWQAQREASSHGASQQNR